MLSCRPAQQDAYFEERNKRVTLQAYLESIEDALKDKAVEFDALRDENAKLKEANSVLEVSAGLGTAGHAGAAAGAGRWMP